jgi:hypothetical protein
MSAAEKVELTLRTDLSAFPPRVQRSKPTLLRFCPDGIPYQRQVMRLVRREFDYSQGNLQILLSGSYGSAKSVLLAHLAITHCLMFRKARVAICRRALPDLKGTLFSEILEHLEEEPDEFGVRGGMREGRDYWVNYSRASIRFKNGSRIIGLYWSDRKYKRMRSLKLSMALIEEGTENDDRDKEALLELEARLRRIPGIPENVLVVATNPDAPAHWLHDYFIAPNEGGLKHPTRYVFYSRTESNIYLDPVYIYGLRKNMDPKRARRYLDGEWIELSKEQVYYSYSAARNFRSGSYDVDPTLPIRLSWDFNIGKGKPLSVCYFQVKDDVFHFFGECVVEGMRTEDSLEEMAARGVLDLPCPFFIVNGDATGKRKDTRALFDDYEIILKFLQNYRTADGRALRTEYWVPLANPSVRERHNRVNAYCANDLGETRLFVYEAAPMLHKGFRLVQLRKRGEYVEDDTPDYQHVTTAAGYGLMAELVFGRQEPQGTRQL